MSLMFGKMKTCNSAAAPDAAVLLGVIGSEKSALIVKFLTKRFISEYDPQPEDIYSSEEIVKQQPVTVRLMDTCDQHVFYEAVRRAMLGRRRSCLVPAVYVSEDKELLTIPFFTTPCTKSYRLPLLPAGHCEDVQGSEQTKGCHTHPA